MQLKMNFYAFVVILYKNIKKFSSFLFYDEFDNFTYLIEFMVWLF